jgi:hypothetical protein
MKPAAFSERQCAQSCGQPVLKQGGGESEKSVMRGFGGNYVVELQHERLRTVVRMLLPPN